MSVVEVDIQESFELLSEKDWDNMDADCLSNLTIDASVFDSLMDHLLLYPRLKEWVFGYNNKIGSLKITYALCKHYYDLGIPDEPWYVSPSLDGKSSIQYDPYFKPEHYMRRFWFNHFASNLYVSIFGIRDSIIELLNMFYGIDAPANLRLKKAVMDWLKDNKRDVYDFLDGFFIDGIYKKASDFRNKFVHGFAPSEVSELHKYKKDITATINDSDASKAAGRAVFKQVDHANILSYTVGEYNPVREVIEAFEQFASLTSEKKDQLITLILSN